MPIAGFLATIMAGAAGVAASGKQGRLRWRECPRVRALFGYSRRSRRRWSGMRMLPSCWRSSSGRARRTSRAAAPPRRRDRRIGSAKASASCDSASVSVGPGDDPHLAPRRQAGRRPKTAANATANPVAATVRPTYFVSMPPVSAATASPLRAGMARAALIGEANSRRSDGRTGVGEEQPVESGRAVRL